MEWNDDKSSRMIWLLYSVQHVLSNAYLFDYFFMNTNMNMNIYIWATQQPNTDESRKY